MERWSGFPKLPQMQNGRQISKLASQWPYQLAQAPSYNMPEDDINAFLYRLFLLLLYGKILFLLENNGMRFISIRRYQNVLFPVLIKPKRKTKKWPATKRFGKDSSPLKSHWSVFGGKRNWLWHAPVSAQTHSGCGSERLPASVPHSHRSRWG